MTDFRTWWKYREGREMTIAVSIVLVFVLSVFALYDSEEEDPNICSNLCIIDKNGIPRYEKWFRDHPEDRKGA
tara:strand:- start:1235 stop:1453 length:219 start_codon:yes stop_codon:yes gene_type:complete